METRIQYPFKTDHDIFIALIEDFNSSMSQVKQKVSDDHNTTLEVKELLQRKYDSMDMRIDAIEKQLIVLNPKAIADIKTDVEGLQNFVRNWNATKHIVWIIASSGFLFMGYYLPNLIRDFQGIFFAHK